MARINYGALTLALRDLIAEDPNVRDADALVEVGVPFSAMGARPFIGIYENRRTATSGQDIAAGTRTRYTVYWDVFVYAAGQDLADASAQRDDLLGHVEIALMGNRSLGGLLTGRQLQLLGGELRSGPSESGFLAQGNISLSAEVVASA